MPHGFSLCCGSPEASVASPASGAATVDLDPYDADFLANPYPFHPLLRDAGPVVWRQHYVVFAMARHAAVPCRKPAVSTSSHTGT